MRSWVSRLFALFSRERLESRLDEEMRAHLELSIEENVRCGMDPGEARRAALLSFGGLEQAKEAYRDRRGIPLLENLGRDLRYAVRTLRKSPGFAVAVVVSMALGLGANTTIFSFVNALLLRPPSVDNRGRLLEIWHHNTKASGIDSYVPLSYPDYVYYRDHNHTFSGLIAFDGDGMSVAWSGSGRAEIVRGQVVSGNFFSVLGVRTIIGRGFAGEDDRVPGTRPVIVLSHRFWTQRLGSDPEVIGKTVILNGLKFTVQGVTPPSFTGILVGMNPDFWTPLMMTGQLTRDSNFLESRGSFWLIAAGRLREGITAAQARADLRVLSSRLQRLDASVNGGLEAATFPVQFVPEPFRGYVAAFTGLLLAVAGMVLLVACANVANLFLARMTARRRELAIRSALGASQGRLVLQTLMETSLLSLIGGGLGLLLAVVSVPALLGLKPNTIPLRVDVPLDWRVIVFTAGLSLGTGLVFGLAPALRAARLDAAPALKAEIAGGGYRISRLRNVLVAGQLAVCLVLLTGAGLCVRSLMNARSIDTGFDTHHAILAELDPGKLGYPESQGKAYYERLIVRLEGLPGVTAVSLSSHLPLGTASQSQDVFVEGKQPDSGEKGQSISSIGVWPRYFEAMGIPLLIGREFAAGDRQRSPQPVIINQAMARRFWHGENPLGRRLRFGGGKNGFDLEIVGVVKTGKYRTLSEEPQPFLYTLEGYQRHATLVVRTAGNPASLLGAVRREIQSVDPNVVPLDLETMEQYMSLPLFPARTAGLLLGTFGAVALVLAITGLFGVVSYVVSQRTREIGIRVALGASHGDVVRLVVGQALRLTLIGTGIGIVLALAAARALASLLYGMGPYDVATLATVTVILAVVALVASGIPARRAARIDPALTLRYE